MDWGKAKVQILQQISVGTDLNTSDSSHRVVLDIRENISSKRYGYKNEPGFKVRIGSSSSIPIPFSVLKQCYSALGKSTGYNGDFFRNHFPKQASDHPCHVHVVGQIFVAAGLANEYDYEYR